MTAPTLLKRLKNYPQSSVNPHLNAVRKSVRSTVGTVFVFSFFVNLLTLAVPVYLLQIYDKVLPGRSMDTLMFLTGIAMVAVLALGLLDSVRRSVLIKLGMRIDNELTSHLLNSAILRAIAKERASANIMRDLAAVRSFLASSSIFPILDVPWTPLFLFILYLLHPILGAIGIAGALIMIGLALFNEHATREPIRRSSHEARELMDDAQLTIKNADVVQAMGMQTTLLNNWQSRNADALIANYSASRITIRFAALSKMLRLFLQIGIVCAAAWLIVNHQLSAGITIASVLLLRRAIGPLEDSIRSWKSVITARGAFENISQYLDHATTLEETSDMPEPSCPYEVHDVRFRRTGERESIFSRVGLRIEPGQICALTGGTGVGKSTLLRVLAGVVTPSSGKITLGGYELGQWTPEQLGPHIGYLPQEVGLFAGSVRDNISRLTAAPIESVIEAATLAGAHAMIQSLPDGYDTILSESGMNLSGGQRQRVGLARALFGSPCIVFLDEPDANLDSSGRSILRKSLRELRRRDIAVVLITHHKSMENQADLIFRLEGGRLKNVSKIDSSGSKLTKKGVVGTPLPQALVEKVTVPKNPLLVDESQNDNVHDRGIIDSSAETLKDSTANQMALNTFGALAQIEYVPRQPALLNRLDAMERKKKRRAIVDGAAKRFLGGS